MAQILEMWILVLRQGFSTSPDSLGTHCVVGATFNPPASAFQVLLELKACTIHPFQNGGFLKYLSRFD